MKIRFITILLLITLSFYTGLLMAQPYTFKVLANKGGNQVKSGLEWRLLKTGESLKDGDEIKMSSPAYIALVHANGKTMELKVAGTHQVSKLSEQIGESGSSLVGKYANYVLRKMESGTKSNRLNTTGAVHRGTGEGNKVQLLLPRVAEVYGSQPILHWQSLTVPENAVYEVSVENMFGDVLYTAETRSPSYLLNMGQTRLNDESQVMVKVKVKGKDETVSGVHVIQRLKGAKSEEVQADLYRLKKEISGESALNNLIMAAFYEKYDLLANALSHYDKARRLAPGVEGYQSAYDDFITRHKLLTH